MPGRTPVAPCGLQLQAVRPLSAPCKANITFGCAGDDASSGMWVTSSCRAVFRLGGALLPCGYHGQHPKKRYHCAVPRQAVAPPAGAQLPECECPHTGLSSFCASPQPGDEVACMGGDAGNTVNGPACCRARPGSNTVRLSHGGKDTRCIEGWSPCAWRQQRRIAWLHTPKTGTSFLLPLARLANDSLPTDAFVPSFVKSRVLQWDAFFTRYPPSKWFRGSAPFWQQGIAHAAISKAAYQSYQGRFFAMFREPRARGLSSYDYFVPVPADGNVSARMPPREYARCIAGVQAGMLTGQLPTRNFGAVACHVPVKVTRAAVASTDGTVDGAAAAPGPGEGGGKDEWRCERHECKRFTPDLALARERLERGFAFVGLVERWALSMCLFCRAFGVRCVRNLFGNSRPTLSATKGGRHASAKAAAHTPELLAAFDDAADQQVYDWAVARFERELAARNLTDESCARDVCPDAADLFAVPPQQGSHRRRRRRRHRRRLAARHDHGHDTPSAASRASAPPPPSLVPSLTSSGPDAAALLASLQRCAAGEDAPYDGSPLFDGAAKYRLSDVTGSRAHRHSPGGIGFHVRAYPRSLAARFLREYASGAPAWRAYYNRGNRSCDGAPCVRSGYCQCYVPRAIALHHLLSREEEEEEEGGQRGQPRHSDATTVPLLELLQPPQAPSSQQQQQQQRRHRKRWGELAHTALVHLRVGDVVDQSPHNLTVMLRQPTRFRSTCTPQDAVHGCLSIEPRVYVVPLGRYATVVARLRELDVRRVVIVAGSSVNQSSHARSCDYVLHVGRFFEAERFDVQFRLGNRPDDDFRWFTRAGVLVPTTSGFSGLAAQVAAKFGVLIVPPDGVAVPTVDLIG